MMLKEREKEKIKERKEKQEGEKDEGRVSRFMNIEILKCRQSVGQNHIEVAMQIIKLKKPRRASRLTRVAR